MLWNSESQRPFCLDVVEEVSWATPGAPEGGGGGVPGSRAVTEGGTGQLGKAETKDGLSCGLWNQIGLGSIPVLPLTGCVTTNKSHYLSEPLCPHP